MSSITGRLSFITGEQYEGVEAPCDPISDFFIRNGLDPRSQDVCDSFAASVACGRECIPVLNQGYCSYTVYLSDSQILQFRPHHFMLDMDVCRDAKAIYGALVPAVSYMGTVDGHDLKGVVIQAALHVYLQDVIPGINLEALRGRPDFSHRHRRRLIEDLAGVFATGFSHGRYPQSAHKHGQIELSKGRVGRSLNERLHLLRKLHGPEAKHVDQVQRQVEAIESHVCWSLTHGDLVPANIMVDPNTGHLTGLIDWAEGEWLPFGTSLYGLEEVLGRVSLDGRGFEYYPDHVDLRKLFWTRFAVLAAVSPPAFQARGYLEYVQTCRTLGILLWRGIAFDNGKIDRVVGEDTDELEMCKLRLFLGAAGPPKFSRTRRAWLTCLWLVHWVFSRSSPAFPTREASQAQVAEPKTKYGAL